MKAVCTFTSVALVFLASSAWANTLYFMAGTDNHLGNSGNWYLSDGMGGYLGAGRLPNGTDNAVILTGGDGGAGVFQVSTLTLDGVGLINGSYSAQVIQMADGSGFSGSTITIANGAQMEIIGTNFGCSLDATTVAIQPGGSFGVANESFLTLLGGTLIYDQGVMLLGDQCVVNGVPGTNTIDIVPGAQLMSSGKVVVEAVGSNGPFTINDNGSVVCNNGFLKISPNVTLISTNGLARFQTLDPAGLMLLNPPNIEPGITFILMGPGTNNLTGATIQGTLQVGGVDPQSGTFVPGNLQFDSPANITGSGLLHVVSSNGISSTMAATNTSFANTTIDIEPGVPFTIVGGAQFISNTVNNAGTVLWTNTFGNQITFSGAATFNNLAGGTFLELDNEEGLAQVAEQLVSVFNNFGTFRIEGGNNTIPLGTFTMQFNNSGLLDVEAGIVDLNNGTNSGHFNVASNATLVFFGLTNFLNSGASFTGAGMYQANGTLFVNGNVTIPNLDLVSSSPIIDGPGQLTIGNNCVWSLGTLQGSGTFNVAPTATMTINGGVTLYQRTINNSGSVIWSAQDNLISGDSAVINNLGGGLFDIETSASFRGFNVPPVATLNNFGTVAKSAGGTGSFSVYVNNAGTFEVLTQGMNFSYLFQQTAGSTILSGGTIVTAPGGFNILGGTFSGTGTFNGSLTNSGTVHPGVLPGTLPGVLTLASGGANIYTQSVTGTLSIELGGRPPAVYSQLAAPGVPVSLGGSLDVNVINGFSPVAGQQFTILTCGSLTGTFPVLNGTYLGKGLALVPIYSSTNVTLIVSNITVLQPLISVSSSGSSLELTWPSVIGQPYQVEYSADLMQWFVLSNFIASATSSSVFDPTPIPDVPIRFYRLR